MFSGKSEEMIRRLRRAEIAGQRVVIFKPRIDDRYDATDVVSHAGARMALSSLGARRLSEMLDLSARVVAIELAVATQAVDLRGVEQLGHGTAATRQFVRDRIAFLDVPDQMPLPLEDLAGAIRTTAEPA